MQLLDSPRLLADIGSLYARFALEIERGVFSHTAALRCADHNSLQDVVQAYLDAVRPLKVVHAALAVANPVDGDLVRMTNYPWQFSIDATRQALGLETLVVVNDFTALAMALPRLSADANSPWWDKRGTDARETRTAIVSEAWRNTISHLQSLYGADMASWTWGRAHTLTHKHPLGQQAPLDKIFNVGPFAAPGGHETPNNLSHVIGPAPWPVTYGPSTRRVVDLAQPQQAQGINPVGQSGVWPDAHYADQAAVYMAGKTAPQWLDASGHTRSTLVLNPR